LNIKRKGQRFRCPFLPIIFKPSKAKGNKNLLRSVIFSWKNLSNQHFFITFAGKHRAMTFTTVEIIAYSFFLLDIGFIAGYITKILLFNRFLIKKKGIKPQDFYEEETKSDKK